MSFVSEILRSAEKIEIECLDKRIPDIISTIQRYKQDVLQYIDKIYNKFSERPKSNTLLFNKAAELKSDISQLKMTIDDVTKTEVLQAKNKITSYKQQLQESTYALEIASTLIHIHEVLLKVKNYMHDKKYVEATKQFEELKQYKENQIIEVAAFNGLMDKVVMVQEMLRTQVITEFRECVQYSSTNGFVLNIKKNMNIEEILRAAGLVGSDLIDELVTFVWNAFCSIVNCTNLLDISEDNKTHKMVIIIVNENEKDEYKTVFKNLLGLCEFLNTYFNYIMKDDTSIVDYIGNQIRDNLSELIIKNCLTDTIPSNYNELQNYKSVIDDTEHLQQELIRYSIFNQETNSIANYVNNINVLFINKKCQDYITTATEIMKKDLHDMVEIGTLTNANLVSDTSEIFPFCYISKSTLELLNLTDEIMQSTITSQDNREKLYLTVQNIFHIYGQVVQDYHQKLLQTIPQQVALFHNNCMYLSYKLFNWTETYQGLSTTSIEPTILMEKAYMLKEIGNKAFVDSLEQQIKQIEDIMKESGLISVSTLEKLEPITDKSIRQCLRQQELLRTVWSKVLSHSDYSRSIGCILNYLCNFIINELLKVEDISSEAGDHLVDIFKVVLTRGPKLFTEPKEIPIYVKSWYKFNELVFILSSSLVEICDRWADGKGPLALQFKPEEVQKLIRALFQNTDRRAAVLSKIVQ